MPFRPFSTTRSIFPSMIGWCGDAKSVKLGDGHIVRIKNDKHWVDVIRVLNKLPGMWHSRGPEDAPVLLVLDSHYEALVKAGVVATNGREGKARGKKTAAKKDRS